MRAYLTRANPTPRRDRREVGSWGEQPEMVFQVTVQRGRLEQCSFMDEILECSGIFGCQKEVRVGWGWGAVSWIAFKCYNWTKRDIEKGH